MNNGGGVYTAPAAAVGAAAVITAAVVAAAVAFAAGAAAVTLSTRKARASTLTLAKQLRLLI